MKRRNDGKSAPVEAFVKAVDDDGTATEVEVFGMRFVRAALRSDSLVRDGGIEVEVANTSTLPYVRRVDSGPIEDGPYVMYPRHQVGDPNDGGE